MPKKQIYRIKFHNQDKIYEVFAKSVSQGALFGFIEIEQLLFGEKSSVVIDPSEETLKTEFNNVTRTYIPMHAIIRIDEVDKQGLARISQGAEPSGNIAPFPVYTKGDTRKK
jgi:hypothetical protein